MGSDEPSSVGLPMGSAIFPGIYIPDIYISDIYIPDIYIPDIYISPNKMHNNR